MATRKATGLAKKASKQDIANIQQQLADEAAGIADNLGAPSTNAISLKDKVFTLPGGEVVQGPMDVIIVDFIATSKFYEGKYNEKDPQPPVCWAFDKIVSQLRPSENATDIQSEDDCASCPMSQWGSDGDGKACKEGRILAILPPDATDEDQIMTMSVSPTAIKGYDAYVASVAKLFKTPPVGVVTTIDFHPEKSYPLVLFGNPQPNENLMNVMHRRGEAAELLAIEPTPKAEEDKPAPKKKATRKKAVRRRA